MAAPARSPLRRWKKFIGAFESVDAAIEAVDPVHLSRREFRSASGDIVELLCDADDDDQAEQLCLILDDVMAEYLETLRMVPVTPALLVTTNLARTVGALQNHESERVRVLACGIMSGWRASLQDEHAKVGQSMKKLADLPQPKQIVGQQVTVPADARTKKPIKIIPETSVKKASHLTAGIDRGGLFSSEDKTEMAKRKFKERRKEQEDAKRQRRIHVVESPEMLQQRRKNMQRFLEERSQARSGSSKKTFSATRQNGRA